MTTPRRKPAAKKRPVVLPEAQSEPIALKPAQDVKLDMPIGVYEIPIDTPPENLTIEWVREHGTFRPLPEEEHATTEPVVVPVVLPTDPEASPLVRAFARTVRDHEARSYRTEFEVAPGILLLFGYNGLVRVFSGHRHVHIATVGELAEMSDQAVYDAVKAARR